MYSATSAEPLFEHLSPRFTSMCWLKMATAIGVLFADISGGHRCSIAHGSEHRATRCTKTADADGRTRWSLIFFTIYMYNVNDETPLTAMIPHGRPPRILAFGHRDTRGSCPPGSTGVRPRCSTARG